MKLVLHRKVYADIDAIMAYYEEVSGAALADEFYDELRLKLEDISRSPARFHFLKNDIRRANLKRFPYHVLFRSTETEIRILVIRHDRRHPEFGLRRK